MVVVVVPAEAQDAEAERYGDQIDTFEKWYIRICLHKTRTTLYHTKPIFCLSYTLEYV